MAQEFQSAKYLGDWELIPELSHYQVNDPPIAGSYSIRHIEDRVEFSIWWTDASNSPFEIHFEGPLDNEKHASDAPGVTHVKYSPINEMTLDSTAYRDDEVLLYARRIASRDGRLLTVSQTMPTQEGQGTNFQVYRRKESS